MHHLIKVCLSILNFNKECNKEVLKVSSQGISTISFSIDDYTSVYFLVRFSTSKLVYLEYFDRFKGMKPYLYINQHEWDYIKETFDKDDVKESLKKGLV